MTQGVHAGANGPAVVFGKKNLDYVAKPAATQMDARHAKNPLDDVSYGNPDDDLDAEEIRDYLDDLYETDRNFYNSAACDEYRNMLYNRQKNDDDGFSSQESLVASLQEPDSGATVDLIGSKYITSGFAHSPYPERSQPVHIADMRPSHLQDYLEKNADVLRVDGNYLGLWHDPGTGIVYMDISVVEEDARVAREECEQNDQIAFFDLQHGNSVEVDRNATSGQAA